MSRLTEKCTRQENNEVYYSPIDISFYGSRQITNKLGSIEDVMDKYLIDSVEELDRVLREGYLNAK